MSGSSDPPTQIHDDQEAEVDNDQTRSSIETKRSSSLMRILTLVMKLITMVCLIVSMSVLASNSVTLIDINGLDETVHFNDIYAYRYALSVAVIVVVYNLVELPFLIYQIIAPGNALSDNSILVFFAFFMDKVILSLLATGVGAAFGYTVDRKRIIDAVITEFSPLRSKADDFFNRAYVTSTFLLIAVLTSLVSSVLSSLALVKNKIKGIREAN